MPIYNQALKCAFKRDIFAIGVESHRLVIDKTLKFHRMDVAYNVHVLDHFL